MTGAGENADKPKPAHAGIKTLCHACGGSGTIVTQVMAGSMDGKTVGNGLQAQPCKTCKGTGRLAGLVPPI